MEVDHADEVADLAALIPERDAALAAAWNGARQQRDALWHFLAEVEGVPGGDSSPSSVAPTLAVPD